MLLLLLFLLLCLLLIEDSVCGISRVALDVVIDGSVAVIVVSVVIDGSAAVVAVAVVNWGYCWWYFYCCYCY